MLWLVPMGHHVYGLTEGHPSTLVHRKVCKGAGLGITSLLHNAVIFTCVKITLSEVEDLAGTLCRFEEGTETLTEEWGFEGWL